MSSRSRPKRFVEALAALAAFFLAATGAAEACDGTAGEAGVVAQVIDGDTLVLDSGLVVRLAGIAAPKRPLDIPDAAPWPAGTAAGEALAHLALGQAAELRYFGPRRDRYGRARADVIIAAEDGTTISLTEAMLSAGAARIVPAADDPACVSELMKLERSAAKSGLGLWRDPYYAIRAATDPSLGNRQNTYDLVEGRIISVGARGTFVYLDFGRDWSTDFTITLTGAAKKTLLSNGLAPDTLKGRMVRVRGFVEQHGGPSIRVTVPEQIEFLDDASRQDSGRQDSGGQDARKQDGGG